VSSDEFFSGERDLAREKGILSVDPASSVRDRMSFGCSHAALGPALVFYCNVKLNNSAANGQECRASLRSSGRLFSPGHGKGETEGASSRRETILRTRTVRTRRNPSRADITIGWKMDASLASYQNLEPESLSVGLYTKEAKAFPPCAEMIRCSRGVELGFLRMEKAVEEMPLVLLGDSYTKVLDP
jgi:hypothetical protein